MIETVSLMPGVNLRCYPDHRFKQGCLSFQIVRPMRPEEAACNALIPALLLRGSTKHPDLRAITLALDEIYGASVSPMVRRVGDYQTTGLFCSFMEDSYALPGDQVLEPMMEFLGELLLCPRMEQNGFVGEIVDSEKKNLISTIDSERNDKRAYASSCLLRTMCKGDSFGLPRLGTREQVAAITAVDAYAHYRRILRESPIEVFYVGSAPAEKIAELIRRILEKIERSYVKLPAQSDFSGPETGAYHVERMEVAQATLCMGFVTPVTNRTEEFGAAQVMNMIFGGGMTSKLFMNVRERMSLCYSIGSTYYGVKGITTVLAGIDPEQEQTTREEILAQLDACRRGEISPRELTAAKEALFSALRATHDSPSAIEGYYATAALSGLRLTPEEYAAAVEAVTCEKVAEVARSWRLHTTYCLKGVTQ